jgi:hypothetical protein
MRVNHIQNLIGLVSLHKGLCVRQQDREAFGGKIVNRMKSLSMAETDFFALLENNGPAGTKNGTN